MTRGHRGLAALTTLVASLALAGPASAATVRMDRIVEEDEGETFVYGNVAITAAAGEKNNVTVEYVPGGNAGTDAVLVTDTTSKPVAADRCQEVDPNTVRCQDPEIRGIQNVVAELGDMDDRADSKGDQRLGYLAFKGGDGDDHLSGFWAQLEGNAGNDTLSGTAGRDGLHGDEGDDTLDGNGESDYLDGGPGDDVLRGGDGNDNLYAGASVGDPVPAGHDRLEGGDGLDTLSDEDGLTGGAAGIGPDELDGGPGSDSVYSYIGRAAPVNVDFERKTKQGQQGEDDRIVGVENVIGGDGDDFLLGNRAANYIDGGKGSDLISGRQGGDRLISQVNPAESKQNRVARSYGPDRVYGGNGDDVIETLATIESNIRCGSGSDRVALAGFAPDKAPSSLGPLLSHNCERLSMSGARATRPVAIDPYPVKVKRERLVFRFLEVHCCRHVMQIEETGGKRRELAHRRVRGRRVSLRVGRKVIARSRKGRVTLRGKVTRVNVNRFVWRFQLGRSPF